MGQEKPYKNAHILTVSLQCCHHCLVQLHSPPPQFILNQAPSLRPSRQNYACCHHPWKVFIQCFRKLIFLLLAIVFSPIWMSKQWNRKWELSPFIKRSSFWNQFQFGCVFRDNKSRVCKKRASFHEQCEHNCEDRGPRSAVRNVLKSKELKALLTWHVCYPFRLTAFVPLWLQTFDLFRLSVFFVQTLTLHIDALHRWCWGVNWHQRDGQGP